MGKSQHPKPAWYRYYIGICITGLFVNKIVWYMRMHPKLVIYDYNKSCIYSYQSHRLFHWAAFNISLSFHINLMVTGSLMSTTAIKNSKKQDQPLAAHYITKWENSAGKITPSDTWELNPGPYILDFKSLQHSLRYLHISISLNEDANALNTKSL